MKFIFRRLPVPGPLLIKPAVIADNRGFFSEIYKYSEFRRHGIHETFLQENLSRSKRGVVRGFHYQIKPSAQAKLVSCRSGRILDIAVDVRKGSKFFGKWSAAVLDDKERAMLYIPPGFAHGFEVLSASAEVVYKTSSEYSPAHERGFNVADGAVRAGWKSARHIVSDRDKSLPFLKDLPEKDLF